MADIIIPGRGVMNFEALRIERRLREHDEHLSLRRNEHDNTWCVYVDRGKYSRVVLGLGPNLPSDDYVMAKMHEMDTWAHARSLYNTVLKQTLKGMDDREAAAREHDHEIASRIQSALAGKQVF